MIFGNPYLFSIRFDVVKDWTVPGDTWKTGVLDICVGGDLAYIGLDALELKTSLGTFVGMGEVIENEVFGDPDLSAKDFYFRSRKYWFDDGEAVRGAVDLTCTSMQDKGGMLIFMKCEKFDRLVWTNDKGVSVFERHLPLGTVINVLNEIPDMDVIFES
ncbi:MAG: Imm42 family immunity protein [Corticimicrobacter sp.]|uniref:Imm42 family immunity protein n=1 Tax=Corticimicrobacter sp. TaxID=2678536 RepID=UPI0032DBAF4A